MQKGACPGPFLFCFLVGPVALRNITGYVTGQMSNKGRPPKEVAVSETECPSCLVRHAPSRMCRREDLAAAQRQRLEAKIIAPDAAPKDGPTTAEERLAELKRRNAERQRNYRARERAKRKDEKG